MAVVVAIAALALLAGLAMLVLGLRGRRVDDHPLCRRCGFDLTGLPATSDRCPECGRPTTRARIGHRRRRAGPIALGAMLVALALLAGGVVGVGRVRGVDWRDDLPTWWLLRETTHDAVADRADPIDRLIARDATSPLSADRRVALARAIVAVQRDVRVPWKTTWGDWVAQRVVDRGLPDDVRDAFVANLFADAVVTVRPIVRQGDELPVKVTVRRTRGGCSYQAPIRDVFDESMRVMHVDDATVPPLEHGNRTGGFLTVMTGLTTDERDKAWRGTGVGAHSVEWSCPITLLAVGAADGDAPLTTVPLAWRGTVTVEPTDGDGGVRTVAGGDALVRAAVQDLGLRASTRGGSAMLDGRFATTLPFDLAIDAVVRQGDGPEQPLTTITRRRGEPPERTGWGVYALALKAGTAEVILRASPKVARGTTDLTEIWGGEIHIDDVSVVDPAAPATTRATSR